MFALQDALSVLSGSLVGFILGLVGGGGSILAMPLMMYVVGLDSTHTAIGTSAVAVAASAAANLIGHARARTVKWPCATVFAISGMLGAAGGAELGKMVDGHRLLFLFGSLMIVVGLFMLWPRAGSGDSNVTLNRASSGRLLPALAGFGLAVGGLAGFFGIGGGFLIVPGLIAATGMPLINAIGSSLVSVTAFGMTTAVSYSLSGLVDWYLASLFVAGGAIGGLGGIALGRTLSVYKIALSQMFAGIVIAVGIYVTATSLR
jgi:uncharacterized membrane protein YfcA